MKHPVLLYVSCTILIPPPQKKRHNVDIFASESCLWNYSKNFGEILYLGLNKRNHTFGPLQFPAEESLQITVRENPSWKWRVSSTGRWYVLVDRYIIWPHFFDLLKILFIGTLYPVFQNNSLVSEHESSTSLMTTASGLDAIATDQNQFL
jgi:hypothetical protein